MTTWSHVHLVGIGGAGMSGIARILLARGVAVSGSDARDSRTLHVLRALGADIAIGHAAENIGDADVVVVSTAIRATNPEVVAAEDQGVPVIRRAAALAELMRGYRTVVVAGTHGKTTTTSMLTVALQACAIDPSFAIGGDLNEPGSNAHHGSGELFIAEADESDGSFLLYDPYGAVVTNVEADHLDHYGDLAAVERAFAEFVQGLDPAGFLVACADDPGARRIADAGKARGMRVVTYGESADADVRVHSLELIGSTSRFELISTGRRLGEVQLTVPGRHYALDAAGAIAAALELGFPFPVLARALTSFTGARRWFELKGEAGGVRVYDSYAHHPTEIAADLAAARAVAGTGRVVVAFQPHLYSRTAAFAHEFGTALGAADDVVVMEVYAAREDPMPGVTGRLVAAEVPLDADRVVFEPSWVRVPELLAERAHAGDVVLTLGAGDVTQLGPEVLLALQERAS